MKTVLEASRCHTLDRHNWKAQQDVCGSVETDIWEAAVQANFTLDHWPYIKADANTTQCIEKLSVSSLYNMRKAGAINLIVSLLALNFYFIA